jgi:hypothetical protein
MPSTHFADEMGLGMTHASLAAAMFCQLQPENMIFGWPVLIQWGQTHDELINEAQNDNAAVPPEE